MTQSTLFQLGILSGQGALAGAVFHHRLIRQWALEAPRQSDADYPSVGHLSANLPGLDLLGLTDSEAAYPELLQRASFLVAAGARVIAIPCNSLHGLAQRLEQKLGVPVLTPWHSALKNHSGQPWTVLCSPSRKRGMLEHPVSGWLPADALQETLVGQIIAAVVRGRLHQADRLMARLRATAQRAQAPLLLACTELSCPAQAEIGMARIQDSLDDLVRDVIALLTPLTS